MSQRDLQVCTMPPSVVGFQGFHPMSLAGHGQRRRLFGGVCMIQAISLIHWNSSHHCCRKIPLGVPFPRGKNSFSLSQLPALLTSQCSICRSQQMPGLYLKTAGNRNTRGSWAMSFLVPSDSISLLESKTTTLPPPRVWRCRTTPIISICIHTFTHSLKNAYYVLSNKYITCC